MTVDCGILQSISLITLHPQYEQFNSIYSYENKTTVTCHEEIIIRLLKRLLGLGTPRSGAVSRDSSIIEIVVKVTVANCRPWSVLISFCFVQLQFGALFQHTLAWRNMFCRTANSKGDNEKLISKHSSSTARNLTAC